MLVRNTLFAFAVSCCHLYGDDAATYARGKSFAESIQSSLSIADSNPDIADAKKTLDYKGTDVAETQYRSSDLSEAATRATYDSKNQVGSSLLDTQRNSLEHDIRKEEIETLIEDGNAVVSDPMKIIGGKVSTKSKPSEMVETTHTCEESTEAVKHVCVRERVLHPIEIEKGQIEVKFWYHAFDPNIHLSLNLFKKSHLHGSWWHHSGDPRAKDIHGGVYQNFPKDLIPHVTNVRLISAPNPLPNYCDVSVNSKGIFRIRYKSWRTTWNSLIRSRLEATAVVEYEKPVIQDNLDADVISDQCEALETMTDNGLCRYGSVRTIEGPGTRLIERNGVSKEIYRDWWKKEYTYHCQSPSKNNCEPFRKRGCERVKAVCIERKGSLCVNHRKTYVCKSKTKGFEVTGFEGNIPFCLDGNCDDHSWTDNKDFADAMSKMALYKEMQEDMDADKLTVFKGTEHKCNKDVMGFQDCCQGGGWGAEIGVAKTCSASEVELRELKDENKCVYVGTYCAEKFWGFCFRKMKSYCCFGSKLSKIIHEQGRKQLGIDWGSPREPQCRPFTVDEIKSIDFSQMDLSALFDDLLNSTNMDNLASSSKQMTTRWSDKVK